MADVWQIVVTIGGVKIKLLIKSQTKQPMHRYLPPPAGCLLVYFAIFLLCVVLWENRRNDGMERKGRSWAAEWKRGGEEVEKEDKIVAGRVRKCMIWIYESTARYVFFGLTCWDTIPPPGWSNLNCIRQAVAPSKLKFWWTTEIRKVGKDW